MSEIDEFKDKFDVAKMKELFRPEHTKSIIASSASADYSYIASILLHPVTDGRHRLLWLVLAPYCVNVLKMSEDDAVELLSQYFDECDKIEPTDIDESFIQFHVNRAAAIGLMPPKLENIEDKDPDLAEILTKILSK